MRCLKARVHRRWSEFDYSRAGAYFVTTVTRHRERILGRVERDGVRLSGWGRIVRECWLGAPDQFPGVLTDSLIVMPDHVHAIVVLLPTPLREVGMSRVVGWAKGRATFEIHRAIAPERRVIWQRSFHDRIIRDRDALENIRRYIAENPRKARVEMQRRSGRSEAR